MRDWIDTAKTERAGMLILGDSIVNHGPSMGWSYGIAHAASKNEIGLAGSGLIMSGGPTMSGNGYVGARIWSAPPSPASASTVGGAGLSVSDRMLPLSSFAFLGVGFDNDNLPTRSAYDFHVYTAGSGSLGARRDLRTQDPWSQVSVQTVAPTAVAATPGGLTPSVFHLNALSDTAQPTEWTTFNLESGGGGPLEVYYSKLVRPDVGGISVTGWSYSGGTTREFIDDFYTASHWTTAGRTTFYKALVDGDSGKLNVVLGFGINDSRDATPDVFAANTRELIGRVRADWAAAGLSEDDLSFTLMSTYRPSVDMLGTSRVELLDLYRAQLLGISTSESDVSFIDIWADSPAYDEAAALGYIHDGIHPSMIGSDFYGNLFWAAVPEPTCALALGSIVALAFARRRRRAA